MSKKCWMCDSRKYTPLENTRIRRLLEDNDKDGYYVVIPQDPHVWCHILIVLKKEYGGHGKGLVEAEEDDLKALIGPVFKWKNILKKALKCERVYLVCLCDDEPHKCHLHYHLIPVQKEQKTYVGGGLQWLGCLEYRSDMMPFDKCCANEKEARGKYIESMFDFLEKAKRHYEEQSKKNLLN